MQFKCDCCRKYRSLEKDLYAETFIPDSDYSHEETRKICKPCISKNKDIKDIKLFISQSFYPRS